MKTYLVHNMCLPYKKYLARSFRDRKAELNTKEYTTDDIRRFYNKGDRFHPYM